MSTIELYAILTVVSVLTLFVFAIPGWLARRWIDSPAVRDEETITPESDSDLLWDPLEPLRGLDSFSHEIAIRPPSAQLTAWSKLRECERRLAFYRWVESLNLPGQHEYKTLLGDAIKAFLYTYEATLQFALNQF